MAKAKTKAHQRSENLPALRPAQSQEVALPADLTERAREYAIQSRSKKTLKEYAKFWAQFEAWCDKHGRDSLPADEGSTVAAYITYSAARGLAATSIDAHLSAIKWVHETKGHVFNSKNAALKAVRAGIKRDIAKTRTIRRVNPVLNTDLREMLSLMRQEVPREAQDAAVLALAWSAALRRSELVGLDLGRLGTSEDERRTGFLKVSADEMVVTLMTSKASQAKAETVVVPRKLMPIGVEAIENWIKVGNVQPGQPLFRGVKGRAWSENPQSGYVGVCWQAGKWRAQAIVDGKPKHLGIFVDAYQAHLAYCKATGKKPGKPHEEALSGTNRLHDSTVAKIAKRRVRQLAEARNKERGRKKMTPEEIEAIVKDFAGHSMRAGFVTTAANNEIDRERIKQQTRHKSDAMVSVYIRDAGKRRRSGLEGIGV